MAGEYHTLGIYPKGHIMDFLRPTLNPHVLTTADAETANHGQTIQVAGWPDRQTTPQRTRRHRVRDHRRRNRRHPTHPPAPHLHPAQDTTRKPNHPSHRHHHPTRRNHQHHRHHHPTHPHQHPNAPNPQLALNHPDPPDTRQPQPPQLGGGSAPGVCHYHATESPLPAIPHREETSCRRQVAASGLVGGLVAVVLGRGVSYGGGWGVGSAGPTFWVGVVVRG